jgi:hypothetical protein
VNSRRKSILEKNKEKKIKSEFKNSLLVTSSSKKITCSSGNVTRKNSTENKNNDKGPMRKEK